MKDQRFFLFFVLCISLLPLLTLAEIRLQLVSDQWSQITDLSPFPSQPDLLIVLQKPGRLSWLKLPQAQSNLSEKKEDRGLLLELDVNTGSEMGLLGIAFHPRFIENGRIFLHYNPARGGKRSRISEWSLARVAVGDFKKLRTLRLESERILLEVPHPYGNHKAGQLAFGPDGYLYIGMGDGGSGGDPKNNGQNTQTLLGSMLRIDVNKVDAGRAYSIPPDNPFSDGKEGRPEIFAWGLRNPWRFTFHPQDGRLLVADVGQNAYEEVSVVGRGENLGWKIREGRHCYPQSAPCRSQGMTEPLIEYSHDLGQSITGGFVYFGKRLPELRGLYLFGDFVSGRVWKSDLKPRKKGDLAPFRPLGKWDMGLSTFGQDHNGEIYLADFFAGKIYTMTK